MLSLQFRHELGALHHEAFVDALADEVFALEALHGEHQTAAVSLCSTTNCSLWRRPVRLL